ncbi:7-cyano-7-deazaguanine synthase [Streptomyces hygroscopicus subsp. hygroscopicus]|uniref:7-cyano-7-deazaguanine synthase n=1 Tax=Streptomyces hygroscopicus TaxID=1912 RepID=UPI000767C85D|nr:MULTISPECIES: 7-cyano-7-deazaguanine synthase [Streptomyces]MBW8086676.1 7-cyano-7-deazaguanine synthase [Streptomyces hygroscopicus subsp. hygroscopicus]
MSKTVAIVSGGLDSVTMAYHLHAQGHTLRLLSVNYGQRHLIEHEFAAKAARTLGAPHDVVDLSPVGKLMHGSSLTDLDVDVPDQKRDSPGESPNVVPNRNALLLSVAFAVAVAEKAEAVAIGVIDDPQAAPDANTAFLDSFLAMEKVATRGYAHPELTLTAPLAGLRKSGVVSLGEKLGVPWTETWTCMRGGAVHCGRCASCWDRQEAFQEAGVTDPTTYQTSDAKVLP